ncbi:MAG: hypothetical protein IT456_06985 [Planctomycetes bacterium]|jgi:hypothetical protein|nr:hypothetical protein [Planctomycetota bacterium]
MERILGRSDDVARWQCRPGQQRLDDVVSRWSLDANAEWVDDGVRRGEAFLQISPERAGSVLGWELERIRAAGYVAVGPYWVPAGWRSDADSYRRVVRLVAEHVLREPDEGPAIYVPKARAELEPLLALWPHVLALPTSAELSIDDLILARALPVHALGVVARPTWADGRWCSPAEFFFHDLDHARFKVREDLLALGVEIPDAYVDGSTIDPAVAQHRGILSHALGRVGAELWAAGPERAALACRLLASIAAEPQRDLAEAARWLLFELVHEKSFPLVASVLRRELATAAHEGKLRSKCERGFYAGHSPSLSVVARLGEARAWLAAKCEVGVG